MKPLFLSIEGLQSFQDKQEINFEKIGRDGIFGIFGPTGSGKSTIIDGITLALYGSILRFRENKNELKDFTTVEAVNKNSDHAKVNFKFQVGNEIYRVERLYKIGKKSGKLSKSAVLFKVEEGIEEKIAENHREIYEEIRENILGLTLEDFTRSVVLPQGNFSEFLKLSGMGKRSMLERIFQLEKYGDVLTNRANNHKKVLEDKLKNIDLLLESIGFNEDELREKEEELKLLEAELLLHKKESTTLKDEIKEMEEIEKIEIKIKQFSEELIELSDEKENIDTLISQRELVEKYAPILEKAKRHDECTLKINALEKEIMSLEKDLVKARRMLEDERIIYSEKETLEKNLYAEKDEKYISQDEYDEKNEVYNNILEREKLLAKKDEISKEITRISKEKVEQEKVIKDSQGVIKTLENKKENIPHVSNDEIILLEKSIMEKEQEERVLADNIESFKNTITKINSLEEKLKTKEEENKKYLDDRKSYLIYELQKEIKEGDPCPLCGGDYHKEHLEKHELSFDRDAFEELQKEITKIRQEIFSYNEHIKTIGIKELSEVDTRTKSLQEEIKKLQNKKKEEDEKARINKEEISLLETEIKEKSGNLNALQIELTKNESALNEREKNLKEIDSRLDEIPESSTPLDEIKNEIEEIKTKRKRTDEIEKELQLLRKEMEDIRINKLEHYDREIKIHEKEFTKKEENRKSLTEEHTKLSAEIGEVDSLDEVRNLLENIESIKRRITEYENKVSYLEKSLCDAKIDLNDREFQKEKYEELLEKEKNISVLLEEMSQRIGETKNKIDDFNDKKKKAHDMLVERNEVLEELNPAKEIYELLKGRKFIEFLSAGKLQTITRIASDTLQKITNGRYRINVDEKSDFSIMDNFSSAIRKPQSLSGGETFMVSLCLALALANQIQLRGKSKLEFFFLDEGFGTLDSELLDIVFNVLESLKSRGMTVGIITHVEEIKNRIPRKLIVLPAKIGVSGTIVKEI